MIEGKRRCFFAGFNALSPSLLTTSLYGRGQKWLQEKHLIGRVRGYLPYIGMVTILMNDHQEFKWLLIAALGFFVLVNREQG